MLARVRSFLLQGIDALPCEVEVDHDDRAENQRPIVVGLPDIAVKESLERVRSSLTNSGYEFPMGRVLINLAPADVRKEGPIYDLPIAVGLLMGQGVIRLNQSKPGGKPGFAPRAAPPSAPSAPSPPSAASPPVVDVRSTLIAGELALDGRIRTIRGAIAMAALAKSKGATGVILPAQNAEEAAVVDGINVYPVRTLSEVVGLLTGQIDAVPCPPVDVATLLRTATSPIDFADVRGQEAVKRALIIAAAGSHNIIMLGPAGTGKTMMARALPGILPPLVPDEAIQITRIFSAAGQLAPGVGLITSRPVRTPHHTASAAAIVGGGAVPKPGEISLAHHGVLFLDELPEFPRDVLETLRQPLEDHVVTIARSHSAVRFPASFMLVAAMNPTPKGDIPTDEISRRAMDRYLAKLSGPLIDRIDIHVEAPAVPWKQLSAGVNGSADAAPRGTSSEQMRTKVLAARARQYARQGESTPNSRLSGRDLDRLAPMDEEARVMLGQAMTELGLSARAYDKIRRVSRTIADLEQADTITATHVGEAIQYRLLDRK